jgi:hypothetical protein
MIPPYVLGWTLFDQLLDGIICIVQDFGDRFLQVVNLLLDCCNLTFKPVDIIFSGKILQIILGRDTRHLLRYSRGDKLLKVCNYIFIHT